MSVEGPVKGLTQQVMTAVYGELSKRRWFGKRLWRARCSGTHEDLPGWDEFTPEERAHKIDNARNLLLAAVFPEEATR